MTAIQPAVPYPQTQRVTPSSADCDAHLGHLLTRFHQYRTMSPARNSVIIGRLLEQISPELLQAGSVPHVRALLEMLRDWQNSGQADSAIVSRLAREVCQTPAIRHPAVFELVTALGDSSEMSKSRSPVLCRNPIPQTLANLLPVSAFRPMKVLAVDDAVQQLRIAEGQRHSSNPEILAAALTDLLGLSDHPDYRIASRARAVFESFSENPRAQQFVAETLPVWELPPAHYSDVRVMSHQFSLGEQLKLQGWETPVANAHFSNCLERYLSHLKTQLRVARSDAARTAFQDRIRQLTVLNQEHLHMLQFALKYQLRSGAQTITSDLQRLKTGERLLVNGGFKDPSGEGHAMLYEFERALNHTLTLRVFNTGFGVEPFHAWSGQSLKYQTVVELADIPEAAITPEWLNGLKENLNVLGNRSAAERIVAIYDQVFQLQAQGARIVPHPEFAQARQKGGYCSWKVQKAWLKFHAPDVYPGFKQFTDTQLLRASQKERCYPEIAQKYARRLAQRLVLPLPVPPHSLNDFAL